jgi:nicotinate-nucleotide pyrophosphorylase (carboxylating)
LDRVGFEPFMHTTPTSLRETVRRALAEDLGCDDLAVDADVTSRLAVPAGLRGRARIVAKAAGVLAGVSCAVAAFSWLDPEVRVDARLRDGQELHRGDLVLEVEGGMRALLAAERTALNFLQRLSGVATATRAFVDAVAGTGARILDTRKTTPGMRTLEKDAVAAGGGHNHRIGLFDQVLLKENHFGFARPLDYESVVRRCVQMQVAPVVAEARDVAEAVAAVRGGAAVVLLDNFSPGASLRAAVAAVRHAAEAAGRTVATEASGGVDLQTVRAFAESGVDRISIGALTHSARAVDLSLLVEGVT